MADLGDTTASNYSIQPGKPRQLRGGNPDDPNVHTTTHEPNKYPNRIPGLTDKEIEDNEARRPPNDTNDY